MATSEKNLSDFDPDQLPDCGKMKFGIVVSEWNREITDALYRGAYDVLIENKVHPDNIITAHVPGSFELPLASQFLIESNSLDAVICLGSVIRGETSHFDYVCQAVSQGIKDVSLSFNTPVIFGVLTDDNIQQSKDRSGGKHGNKGTEAAVSAIKMAALKLKFNS